MCAEGFTQGGSAPDGLNFVRYNYRHPNARRICQDKRVFRSALPEVDGTYLPVGDICYLNSKQVAVSAAALPRFREAVGDEGTFWDITDEDGAPFVLWLAPVLEGTPLQREDISGIGKDGPFSASNGFVVDRPRIEGYLTFSLIEERGIVSYLTRESVDRLLRHGLTGVRFLPRAIVASS